MYKYTFIIIIFILSLLKDLSSQNYQDLSSKASMNVYLGYYTKAIEEYSEAINSDPNNAELYYNRGIAKENMGDYEGAIKDYSMATNLKPDLYDAYYNRGYCKTELKDYEGAIQDFSKTISLNPNDEEAYYSRGMAKIKIKQCGCEDLIKSNELGYIDASKYVNKYCKKYLKKK